jgi:hypothetical protein
VEADEVGLGAAPRRAGLAQAVGAGGEGRAVGGGAPRQADEDASSRSRCRPAPRYVGSALRSLAALYMSSFCDLNILHF